jgi:hypothetical protein
MAVRATTLGGLALVACLGTLVAAPPAAAAVSYKSCTELNKTYKHGIGRANARDRTTGVPVTSFRKDTAGYDRAMRANRGLDRDRDGIACEKR